MKLVLMMATLMFAQITVADDGDKKSKVKYKAASRIDFESLLIEGERKKPEMAVVTGNIGEKDSGLLKFRKDFLDVMADDFGEAVE
jgi:hypothetical protein